MHVVDTSVVLKWIVAEQDSETAQSLVGMPLAAPDLIRAELANALWKKVVLHREIGAAQARRGLERASRALALIPAAPLAERALMIAVELQHPVYDCFFLAMADELDVPLITADERLCRKLQGSRYSDRMVPLRTWEVKR